MPDTPPEGDFDARLRVVEREVIRLREQVALSSADATAARVLAAGADHDVSEVRAELRAHTQVLNALRVDQIDLRAHLDGRVNALEGKVDIGFAEMRARFDQTAAGQQRIVDLLDTLIAGQD